MNQRRISRGATFFLGLLSSLLVLGGHLGTRVQAGCPNVNKNGWPANGLNGTRSNPIDITYSFSQITFSNTELNNIGGALSNWTFHNTTAAMNCSNVIFSSTTGIPQYSITANNGQLQGFPGAAATTTIDNYSGSLVQEATTTFYWGAVQSNGSPIWNRNGSNGYYTFIKKVMLHEAGHTMGLSDRTDPAIAGQTVMNGALGTNDSNNFIPTSVQPCDDNKVNTIPQYALNCQISSGGEEPLPDPAFCVSRNPYVACLAPYLPSPDNPTLCCLNSPIVIDVEGNNYNLTDADNGVLFDINGDGVLDQIAWTAAGSDDAWLVLDRNGNGSIDNGKELFGNYTTQSPTSEPNGFIALAEYNKLTNGGNGDGMIDSRDAIFTSLRLWQDRNHNGISEPNEMYPLPTLGLAAIDLDYRTSRRRDRHGNAFRYRAKVYDTRMAQLGRWAWDVFLVVRTP